MKRGDIVEVEAVDFRVGIYLGRNRLGHHEYMGIRQKFSRRYLQVEEHGDYFWPSYTVGAVLGTVPDSMIIDRANPDLLALLSTYAVLTPNERT